ncbi:hypothetical protein [Agrobacterium tumefaciens]|uniref:hypothetical protein n=1 Tax=Agrobacterium tumefaciens TaxID=358 RepID=UPI002243CC86|nr:hypothetical protein [Agrobacterium tumefaciens]MCW8060433.1 hypothetical protein [Agrobacterium tumefaciens]MCW8145877.1 hypothetical protein [Agrobacterium tumefaciens]
MELMPKVARQIADLSNMDEYNDGDTVLMLDECRTILRAGEIGIMIRVEAVDPLMCCGIKSLVTSAMTCAARVPIPYLQWKRGTRVRFLGLSAFGL